MTPLPADLDRLLHDLRGPLNAMLMHIEVLKRLGPPDAGARPSLEALQQEVGRLALMLPAVFEVVGLEPGPPGIVNLRTPVENALATYPPGQVMVDDATWPDVRGDAALLTLAVGHLLRNALQATQEAGPNRPVPRVSVQVNAPADVSLVVRDWGRGLRTTNPRSLIRLAPGRVPGRGGIGLVTVERIARLHGGALEFRAPEDGGAEVRLTFPLAQ